MSDAARRVPASATPSPSALAYCSLAICPRESLCAIQLLTSAPPGPCIQSAKWCTLACRKLHLPAGSHAHQQHNTNYDSDGSESDSTWGACGPVSVLSNLCERPADLYLDHPFKDGHSLKDGFFYIYKIRPTFVTTPADFENGRGLW